VVPDTRPAPLSIVTDRSGPARNGPTRMGRTSEIPPCRVTKRKPRPAGSALAAGEFSRSVALYLHRVARGLQGGCRLCRYPPVPQDR